MTEAISQQHTVLFQPSGISAGAATGESVRQVAASAGVDIESICAERGTCGKCAVVIEPATPERSGSVEHHVSPMTDSEQAWLARRTESLRAAGIDPGRARLSCQARIKGDIVVFIPEMSRGSKQIIRKAATDRHIEIDPVIRRYYVEITPPTLADPASDAEQVATALVAAMKRVHGADRAWSQPEPDELHFDIPVMQSMSEAIRAGDWKVSVTVWQGREITDVRPGYDDAVYGVAVDIGTTSIAVYVTDLTTGSVAGTGSAMNPQIAHGDDIMSRMAYANDYDGGHAKLRDAIRIGIAQLITETVESIGINATDVHDVVIVGNTVMHHLFLGIPTRTLSIAPFVPATYRDLDLKARDLGLPVNPGANVHVLPIAASFVGSDAMAVTIAEEPYAQDDNLLIIDVGTNAELIAGNRNRLICTSTPTGPAFEGAHIEFGMRAAVGAIERIEIDDDKLTARYKVIGRDGWRTGEPNRSGSGSVRGIAGSAIIDGVAEMFRCGIITPRGHFAEGLDHPRIRDTGFGREYVVVWANDTTIGRDITITLHDVRQIQLAKAALYTAADTLRNELEVTSFDRVILAGAFGSRIDKTKAMIIGMIPDCPLEHVYSVGNAAGDGARVALLNRSKRLEARSIAQDIERIELPVDPSFQNGYMAAMNFPHMDHHFTSLEGILDEQPVDPLVDRLRDS